MGMQLTENWRDHEHESNRILGVMNATKGEVGLDETSICTCWRGEYIYTSEAVGIVSINS